MALGKEFWQNMRKYDYEHNSKQYSDFRVENYKKYEFQTWTNKQNKPVLKIYSGKSGKPVSYHYYLTVKSRNETISRYKELADRDERIKAEQKKAKSELINSFSINDIVYNSWGYDQTNIDFYQITKTTKKSVKMRPISSKFVESTGIDQGMVVPVPNNFTGKEKTKILQVLRGSGKVYIKSKHGWISRWDGSPVWSSWYY